MRHACLIGCVKPIEIPVRELHARTGHYVRKAAAKQRIIITDRGKRIAELHSLTKAEGENGEGWGKRQSDPEFSAIVEEPIGGTESVRAVSEDRDRG